MNEEKKECDPWIKKMLNAGFVEHKDGHLRLSDKGEKQIEKEMDLVFGIEEAIE